MKILFITNTPPVPSWGGAMTFYRHFVERKDFTISVITNDTNISSYNVQYPYLIIDRGKLWKRVSSSRLHKSMQTLDKLMGYYPIPKNVLEFAKEFKPDAIFTVAGSWQGMALLARDIANKLNVPLIGSFNDWWYYSATYLPKMSKFIERKFRSFYLDCDLAICTSEGMQSALGKHKNSIVLYPTGAPIGTEVVQPGFDNADKSFTVAFGGSLADWYGTMLESVVKAANGSDLRFKIFGGHPSWSSEFDSFVKNEGIYKGLIPFDQLKLEMANVDGLLLLMGFDESCAVIETTSFKTKFLDYLSFRKPIILWGPSYCSAVAIAEEFKSAEICTSPNPSDFLESIKKVKDSQVLRQQLINNSLKMYNERFNPDKLHFLLKNSIYQLNR